MSNAKRAVVLLSGGLDSATTLGIAVSRGFECLALSFDYGQRHLREVKAAEAVAKFYGVRRHVTQKMDLRTFGGSALTAEVAVPKDRGEKPEARSQKLEGIPITYVPARNMIFLAFAVGFAEVAGAADIFLGVNAVDYSGYPDCRPAFVKAFERVANLGTRAGVEGKRFKIHAPLMQMSKAEIIHTGLTLGIPYQLTHSCYDPVGDTSCGHCDACLIRLAGFREAGVTDPIEYL
ncbi:MAG: 7-cyano-7-deazaguanine synthase QueC [Phycisphaerales bacterium]|nr:7-cyano-7-deazaguanine synthase QueC [Phycisphaerales bacterium]